MCKAVTSKQYQIDHMDIKHLCELHTLDDEDEEDDDDTDDSFSLFADCFISVLWTVEEEVIELFLVDGGLVVGGSGTATGREHDDDDKEDVIVYGDDDESGVSCSSIAFGAIVVVCLNILDESLSIVLVFELDFIF